MEANEASSKRDFTNKIKISRKESNESKHWLRMISRVDNKYHKICQSLWKQAHELTLIFSKIIKSCTSK